MHLHGIISISSMKQEEGNAFMQDADGKKIHSAPSDGSSGTSPVQKKSSFPPSAKKEKVDLASINALPLSDDSDVSSDEYVRGGEVPVKKVPAAENHRATPDEKGRIEKKEFTIPVLRTYQSDTRDIAETKGGGELRTILAKEAEEKKTAQKEYLQKTRNIMKESVVLQDEHTNILREQAEKKVGKIKGGGKEGSDPAESVDRQRVTKSVSGALAYMQSVQPGDEPSQAEGDALENADKDEGPVLEKKDANADKNTSLPEAQIPAITPPLPEETADDVPLPEKKQGLFARMRGRARPEDVFTEEDRRTMQEKQNEIIEKESIEDAWQDFQKKKERLQEQGLKMRDVRSFDAPTAVGASTNKQSIFSIIFVFIFLSGLIFGVVFIATRPNKISNAIPLEELKSVPDVIGSENKVFVDMSATPDEWPSITKRGDISDVVSKYVPYENRNTKSVQIDLDEFSRNFIMRIPPGLRSTLGDYYFVGNYVTQTDVNGIFIVSVENYNDALIWMLKWEKNAINSLISVFPTLFQRSNPENVSAEIQIIDNKDVRILKNSFSDNDLMYYFFNRSVLVFIAGDKKIIPIINARIRSANTG